MKLLGTITYVGTCRQYQKNGEWRQAYPVQFRSGDDTFFFEVYRSHENLEKAGIVRDAVGNIEIRFNVEPFTDKDGKQRLSNKLQFVKFELANKNLNKPAQEEVVSEASQEPEAQQANMPDGFVF